MADFKKVKSKAFTLAEILLTLTIIGIVAALTIPSLLNDTKDKDTVIKLKKHYNTIYSAYNKLIADGYDLDSVMSNGPNAMNSFANALIVTKNCGKNTGCFPNVSYKNLDGSDNWNINSDTSVNNGKAILNDGTLVLIWDNPSGTCVYGSENGQAIYCGELLLDLNGFKPPNQYGRDTFVFKITAAGIYPYGNATSADCSLSVNGYKCAARVLKEDAINY